MPVGIECNRHYWLDVHKPLGTISLGTDIPVVVSEERYADEGGERVGELFGQSFAVLLRKRGAYMQMSAAMAAKATKACIGPALFKRLTSKDESLQSSPVAFLCGYTIANSPGQAK